MFVNQIKIEKSETNCPLCGRPLWECVSGDARKYCDSCNRTFEVKKVG